MNLRRDHFSVVPNDMLADTRLSIGARWLMCFLCTKPQDWQLDRQECAFQGQTDVAKIDIWLRELESLNYITVSP